MRKIVCSGRPPLFTFDIEHLFYKHYNNIKIVSISTKKKKKKTAPNFCGSRFTWNASLREAERKPLILA